MVFAAAEPHTSAVITALEDAAVELSSQVMVGRGKKPTEAGWQGEPDVSIYVPYVVLYPTPGQVDGNVADPAEYLIYTVQGNCVAHDQQGAEMVADLFKYALVDLPLNVPGRASYRGQLILDVPVTRDDALTPPVHYAVLQVRWRTQSV